MMFFGRKQELEALNRLLGLNCANLVVIKGRRRVGKSRLIKEFAKPFKSYQFVGLPPYQNMTAQDQRNEFIRKFKEQFDYPEFQSNDWGDLFTILAKQCQHDRIIITFDEITWMAHDDPTFLGKLKTVWDTHFSNNSKLILILCGSISAWIDKNILSSTGYLGRPSLHMTIEELPLKDCNKFWPIHGSEISAFEKFKILAVTGGIPRYLELIDHRVSAEDNISKLFFSKDSPLYDEFKFIFTDIYGKKSGKYQEIVKFLSSKIASREEILQFLKLQSGGEFTEYLDDLQVGGFIEKDYTWNIKTQAISSMCHYRLKDNYTRFYLKYILPNKVKIEKGLLTDISINNLPGWQTILALQFENLVNNNHNKILEILGISGVDVIMANPYFQRATSRQHGCQIDYLIQTKQDVVYICEIKFSREPITTNVISEVREKINRVAMPKHISRRAVLIHANGVSDSVIESDFFVKIIDFSQFLQG
jgi:AAA+ ATPase superfamily predicted ATPase